jgi:hypothetical protein
MLNIESYAVDRAWKLPEKNWLQRRSYRTDIDEYHEHSQRLCVVENIESLSQKFKRLLAEWREQSAPMSSITAMAMLPSYQEIIGMGKPALPLILNQLKKEPDYLFWALKSITGIDPVPPKDIGDMKRMARAWIDWGRNHGIIE